ncbi:hypothetical protein SAMN05421763_102687 [[Luteovulum] sphaeroides subsp. megalophilum]|nr:hypothetical protein SAMN05421763_102687 [[Luteovulum] sphaeroides subsp. megalophilum]
MLRPLAGLRTRLRHRSAGRHDARRTSPMGIVKLIQVGQPMNKADVAEVPVKGAAKKRFDPPLAQIAE